MQIDFHHTATYVIARFAGFNHDEAQIIGHSAQYVDDATNDGTIAFNNGAMYKRFASAHKMLDYRNFAELANHTVWLPFHFLPGNAGKPAGEDPSGEFIEKIICRPNSFIARDMVRDCIANRHKAYGLHRLGVTMHVYADTWAHQGFAGVNHKINLVQILDENKFEDASFKVNLRSFFGDTLDKLTSRVVGGALPLGHGPVLSYPDRPYLKWSYKDHNGNWVYRDNPRDYMEAADEMCRAMQRFRLGDPDANVAGMSDQDKNRFRIHLLDANDEDGSKRHALWLKRLSDGYFTSLGPVQLTYIEKGVGSWKHSALGTEKHRDGKGEIFPYTPEFLTSHWKHFHDAVLAHRFAVIHDILPRYGICAA